MRALKEALCTHMLKEERELLPQLQRLFTRDELVALVGRIMGDRPADIVEDILRLKVIKKNLVKKAIEMFQEIAENAEDYKKFYASAKNSMRVLILLLTA